MKTRVKAKALSLVMAAIMVFTMTPSVAFAAEQAETPDPAENPAVSEEADKAGTTSTDDESLAGGEDAVDRGNMAPQPAAAPAKAKAAPNAKIKVTINNKGVIAKTNKGKPMARQTVTVVDLDRDGKLTVDEAFIATHKAYNNEDGYASNEDGWITKLWGDDSGNFWTFVNDKGIQGAGDEVKKGDHMYASIFADPMFNDWYTTFNKSSVSILASREFTLNLRGFYGTSENPEWAPAAGIQIGTWSNGEFKPLKDVKTDENGNVKLKFTKAGTYYVTAKGIVRGVNPWSEKEVDCPTMAPMCVVTAKAAPNAKIKVTINNKGVIAKTKKGNAMARRTVTVKDLNKDGRLTVHEAFIAAHKGYNRYSTTASKSGYASNKDGFIQKLWGNNSGNFLTYINGKGIWSTHDTIIKKGNHLYASINKDKGGNDWYTTFNKSYVKVKRKRTFTLNLKGFYGMSVNPKAAPVVKVQVGTWSKGKFKRIRGAKTDAKGNVKLKFKYRGTYYVTAKGYVTDKNWEGKTVKCPIMAPACKVKVTK